jgi:hypothetical protein
MNRAVLIAVIPANGPQFHTPELGFVYYKVVEKLRKISDLSFS